MKLKKLLAAVTAAALAVTTVAVTSFTASAAAKDPVEITLYDSSTAPAGEDCGSGGKTYSVSSSQLSSWGVDADGLSNCSVVVTYAEAPTGGVIGINANNTDGEIDWTANFSYTDSISGVTTSTVALSSVGDKAATVIANGLTVQVKSAYVSKIDFNTGSSTENVFTYTAGAISEIEFNAAAMAALEGASGISAQITGTGSGWGYFQEMSSWSSTEGGNPATLTSENEKWDTFVAASGIKIVFGGFDSISKVVLTITYPEESEDNGEFEIEVNPSEKTIAVDEDFTVTVLVTGTTPVLVNVDGSMQATYDAAIVSVDNGTDTDDGTVYTITGVAAGTTTVDFEWMPDEGTGIKLETPLIVSCDVTVTDGTTPPVTGSAIWEGNTDMGTDWSANVQIAANKFADIKAGDTLKYTFTCEPDAQMKIASLAEGWPVIPGPNPDPEWGIINISDTSFSFVLTAADVTALKEYGMAVSGKNYTLTKVELIPKADPKPPVVDPGHEHTIATAWSSDSDNHWHACAGCDEKLDLAAHTSDNGTVTTPATETTSGTRIYKCTVCEYVIRTETIPATGTAVSNPSNNVGAPVIPVSGVNNSNVPVSGDKSGWEAISSDAASASDGDRIVVDMNGTTKIPSTVFKDISGKDVDLVLNMGSGIKWTINGLSVTSNKTIDFDVTKNTRHIPNEAVDKAEGRNKKQISLDHNGSFGCTATMTYDIGTKNNGLFANLFYYNPKTKELELIDCSMISGGKANFVFTHASDYLITITDEPLGDFEDVSSAAGIASNGNVIGNGIVFSAVLTVIVLGFGIVVYRKRRHN